MKSISLEHNDIWVFVEYEESKVLDITFELLSEGRKLSDQLGKNLGAVVFGYHLEETIGKLIPYGLDSIFFVDDKALVDRSPELYCYLLVKLIKDYSPSIILFGATYRGQDLASRIAAKTNAGIISNCTNFKVPDSGSLIIDKLCYSSKLWATMVFSPQVELQMFTVLPGVMKINRLDTTRKPSLQRIKPNGSFPKEISTKILDLIKGDPRTIDITEAEVIVAGGRGIGTAENFQLVWRLADLLGASVAGTRYALDFGWISKERLIGQTGKSVAPKLVVSCGISGAIQHTVGIKDAETIIAINRDPGAPIFKMADLGIVGDITEILPAIMRHLAK